MSNSYQPAFSAAGTHTHDNLIAGDAVNMVTESIVLDTGDLTRGALLGKITVGSASAAAKSGGNTGGGTISSVTVGTGAQAGVYTVRIVEVVAGAGQFQLRAPDGDVVGIGSVGTEFTGGGLTFTLTDGSPDFALGDGFDITVAAGSGKYVLSTAAATNGSENPVAILAEDANATSADVTTVAYLTGEFNSTAMTFGSGHTAASVKEALALRGIFLKTNQPA